MWDWVLALANGLPQDPAQPQRASQWSFIGVHVCVSLLYCQVPTCLQRKGSFIPHISHPRLHKQLVLSAVFSPGPEPSIEAATERRFINSCWINECSRHIGASNRSRGGTPAAHLARLSSPSLTSSLQCSRSSTNLERARSLQVQRSSSWEERAESPRVLRKGSKPFPSLSPVPKGLVSMQFRTPWWVPA